MGRGAKDESGFCCVGVGGTGCSQGLGNFTSTPLEVQGLRRGSSHLKCSLLGGGKL